MLDATTTPLEEFRQALVALERRLDTMETRVDDELAEIRAALPGDRAALIVFSGDLDKVLAAFIIATGAATMGLEVTMFFTFWGLSAIKERRTLGGKNFAETMMAMMTPAGTQGLDPSKMAFFGAGAAMLRQMMKGRGVSSLEELMDLAREMEIKFVACDMSVQVMGIDRTELRSDVAYAGVAGYLGEALNSKLALFI